MARGLRKQQSYITGLIDDNPLVVGSTTLNSSALANMAVIASPDIAVLVLDPASSGGSPEIVHITAHGSAATSATIVRAREGTSARQHAQNIPWIHGPTVEDWTEAKDSRGHTSFFGSDF